MKVLVIWLAILFASICNAQGQEHTATVTEDLGDDQFIAVFGGKEYRMINAAKAVELAKQKAELTECRDNEGNYKQIILLAARDVTIANQQRNIERTNFLHAMSLYEKEREMRQELSKFVPKGPPKGIAGAFIRFLDSPAGEIAFRLVVPSAQFVKVMRQ